MEAHFESSDRGSTPLQVSAVSGWVFPMIDTGRKLLASELSFISTFFLKLVLSFFQLTIMQFFWFYSQLILQIWKDTFRQKCRYSFIFELSFQLGRLVCKIHCSNNGSCHWQESDHYVSQRLTIHSSQLLSLESWGSAISVSTSFPYDCRNIESNGIWWHSLGYMAPFLHTCECQFLIFVCHGQLTSPKYHLFICLIFFT